MSKFLLPRVSRSGVSAKRLQPLQNARRAFSSGEKEINVREALNSALDEEIAADSGVFLMGEVVKRLENIKERTRLVLPV